MATEPGVINIAGEDGLQPATLGELDLLNTVVPCDTPAGATKGLVLNILRQLLILTASGDLAGSGPIGTIIFQLNPNVVGLPELASQTPHTILAYDSNGDPEVITIGAGLTKVGSVLMASTPAAANPFTASLTRRFARGF